MYEGAESSNAFDIEYNSWDLIQNELGRYGGAVSCLKLTGHNAIILNKLFKASAFNRDVTLMQVKEGECVVLKSTIMQQKGK